MEIAEDLAIDIHDAITIGPANKLMERLDLVFKLYFGKTMTELIANSSEIKHS